MKSANLDLAERYLAASFGFVTDGLAEFYAPDFVQDELPNVANPKGARRDGPACIAGARKGREILASQEYEIRNVMEGGDWVAFELFWSGVLSQGFGPVQAGSEMKADIAMFLQIKDGKLVYQRNYDCYHPFV